MNVQIGFMAIKDDLERKTVKEDILESHVKMINQIEASIMRLGKSNRDIHVEYRKVISVLKTDLNEPINNMK
jgi:hypothetical protein